MFLPNLCGLGLELLYLFDFKSDAFVVHAFAILRMLVDAFVKGGNDFEILRLIDSLGWGATVAQVGFI